MFPSDSASHSRRLVNIHQRDSHVHADLSLLYAGTLNAFLKQKGQTSSEGPVWSLNGNQGDHWKQAKVSIHPTSSFQVSLHVLPSCLFPLSVFVWVWVGFLSNPTHICPTGGVVCASSGRRRAPCSITVTAAVVGSNYSSGFSVQLLHLRARRYFRFHGGKT